MNQKTARLIRCVTHLQGGRPRTGKRFWNRLPRTRRHAMRLQLQQRLTELQ